MITPIQCFIGQVVILLDMVSYMCIIISYNKKQKANKGIGYSKLFDVHSINDI